MRIAEIYRSLQGEGRLAGADSVFIRASGCNLRCWFCDTPYASWAPEGEDRGVDELVDATLRLAAAHVVLTGGEPLLFAEAIPLCAALQEAGKHVTIETAGTLHLPVACDLMSISPKLANSTPSYLQSPRWHQRHEKARHAPDVVRRLMHEHDYQLKFVVDRRPDCDEMLEYLSRLGTFQPENVYVMPQGIDIDGLARTGSWLEPWCSEHGFHFCPRRQIEWFGPVRGT